MSRHALPDDPETLKAMLLAERVQNERGVALVVNGGPIMRPSNALKAYTSPVAYFDQPQFEQAFAELLNNVEGNSEILKAQGEEKVQANMFAAFR
jgi:hypothetical protein